MPVQQQTHVDTYVEIVDHEDDAYSVQIRPAKAIEAGEDDPPEAVSMVAVLISTGRAKDRDQTFKVKLTARDLRTALTMIESGLPAPPGA